MAVIDDGAPTGGLGITRITKTKEIEEADGLIGTVQASQVNRTKTRNSIYTSKNFHIDAKPIGKGFCNAEVQRKTGPTVAVAKLASDVSSDTDVRAALRGSLGNQHIWRVTTG
jgi:hypothetical protein